MSTKFGSIQATAGSEPDFAAEKKSSWENGDENGDDSEDGPPTAANRLTISGWDLVSKQPHFKYAAVALRPVAARADDADAEAQPVPARGHPRMDLPGRRGRR